VLRELIDAAWAHESEQFTDADWDHALGGVHFVVEEDGITVAHASVVERELQSGGHRLATRYVEAIAALPAHRGRGHGSALMREVIGYIDQTFQVGALSTGRPAFYERLGWVLWRGPTYVRTDSGLIPTPEEDGSILVRLTPASPDLDLWRPISCEWRRGDVW
jgi:aminoglycoside 2'-N-acetyltransferase I